MTESLDNVSNVAGNIMKAVCKEILQPVEDMLYDYRNKIVVTATPDMLEGLDAIIKQVQNMQL